jgi:Rho GDP-dissociation inhibitor
VIFSVIEQSKRVEKRENTRKIMDQDLEPTQDSEYKVGEKKTIQELQNLDSNDESLRKWKESLGLSAAQSGADSRKVVVLNMALQVEGRPDMVMDLTNISRIY